MHFACPALAIFHRLPSMKVLNYGETDQPRLTTWNAFIAECDSVYDNNWAHADDLAPYGQGASTDMCLMPEKATDTDIQKDK